MFLDGNRNLFASISIINFKKWTRKYLFFSKGNISQKFSEALNKLIKKHLIIAKSKRAQFSKIGQLFKHCSSLF